jgi:hypothetical protein
MVAAQDGPHRHRVDGMLQVRQGALYPAIAPARVAGNLRDGQEAQCPAPCRCRSARASSMGSGKRLFESSIRASVLLPNRWQHDPPESNALYSNATKLPAF